MGETQLFGAVNAKIQRSAKFAHFLMEHVAAGALALGPVSALAQTGDYFVTPVTDGSHFVVRGNDGNLRRFLNACPHYHRLVHAPADDWSKGYAGSYRYGRTQCGGHKWGSDLNGTHVVPIPLKVESGSQCTNLTPALKNGQRIEEIGGIAWIGTSKQLEAPRKLLELPLAKAIGLTHYVKTGFKLARVWVDRGRFGAFTGMLIFEDMNHPEKGIHDGKLGLVARMREQRRDYNPEYGVSLQVVPWIEDADPSKMSVFWRRYYTLIKKAEQMGIADPSGGLIAWAADYNNFFTNEHYPYMIVNSWFLPTADGGVRNVVEFYFPEEVLERLPELAEAGMAAYMGGTYTSDGQVIYEEGIAQEDAKLAQDCERGMDNYIANGQGGRVIGPLDPVTDAAVHAFHKYMNTKWVEYCSWRNVLRRAWRGIQQRLKQ